MVEAEQPPSWRLVRSLVRETRTGNLIERTDLVSTDVGYYVKEATVVLDANASLGLNIVEMDGKRTVDGYESPQLGKALCMVESLVEGGVAWKRAGDMKLVEELGCVQPGDVIVAVSDGEGMVISTEGRGFSFLLEAIAEVTQGTDQIVLVVKRLVRRRRALVIVESPTGEEERRVPVYDGDNLRTSLLRAGVADVNDPDVERYDFKGKGGSCNGQGICATCTLLVMRGAEHLNEKTPSERQLLRKVVRWRQSCRAYVTLGDDVPRNAQDPEIRVKLRPRSRGS